MMLSQVGPRGSPHRRLGSKLVGAGRHHGAGEQVHPTRGPHLLLLLLIVCGCIRDMRLPTPLTARCGATTQCSPLAQVHRMICCLLKIKGPSNPASTNALKLFCPVGGSRNFIHKPFLQSL